MTINHRINLGHELLQAKRQLLEIEEGRPARGTIADLLDDYLAELKRLVATGKRAPRTLSRRQTLIVFLHERPQKMLDDAPPSDLDRYRYGHALPRFTVGFQTPFFWHSNLGSGTMELLLEHSWSPRSFPFLMFHSLTNTAAISVYLCHLAYAPWFSSTGSLRVCLCTDENCHMHSCSLGFSGTRCSTILKRTNPR